MSLRNVLIAATLLLALGCSGSNNSTPASPSTSTPTTPSSTSTGPSVIAAIPGGASLLSATAFGANPLTVATGTTVVDQQRLDRPHLDGRRQP